MSDAPETSFEEAVAQLEEIVRELEGGETGLEQSLSRYEEGISLLKRCFGQLRQAEQKIMLLTGEESGVPALRPFEHTASIEEKREEITRRRAGNKSICYRRQFPISVVGQPCCPHAAVYSGNPHQGSGANCGASRRIC